MKAPVNRILSFALALLVLCSLPMNLTAQALAVETAWVTYAIISFLVASGVTFTATGGIQALQNAVEEKTETYYEVTGIDLFGIIKQSVRMAPNGNGGNKLWIAAAATVAMAEFAKWLRTQGWAQGEVIETYDMGAYANTELVQLYNYGVKQNIQLVTYKANDSAYSFDVGSNSISTDIVEVGTVVPYLQNISFLYGTDQSCTYGANYLNYQTIEGKVVLVGDITTFNLQNYLESKGYTLDEFVGFTFALDKGTNYIETYTRIIMCCVMHDGTILRSGPALVSKQGDHRQSFTVQVTEEATIIIPQEFTEYEYSEQEQEGLAITFPNITADTPEEFAEELKETIIETGTLPEPITQVEPIPDDLPVVTPYPTDPEYPVIEDIDGLGLPQLGEALFERFPFSLPKDLKRIVNILFAERKTPYWEIDIFEHVKNEAFSGDTGIVIDLSDYEALGTICRWSSVISVCIALIIGTKRMIGW